MEEIELEVGLIQSDRGKGYGIQNQEMRLIVIVYCSYLLYQSIYIKRKEGRRGRTKRKVSTIFLRVFLGDEE